MADQNFLDSPWFQLGAPLAATIATAIAPRHAGPAAAIGMAGYNGINRNRAAQMRLSQLRQEQQNDEDTVATLLAQVNELDPEVQNDATQHAPEAGSVPEVTANANTNALASGQVPKVHGPRMSHVDAQYVRTLLKAKQVGPAVSFMNQRMSAVDKPEKPERHFTNFTNPDNQSVTNVLTFGPDGGTNETNYIAGDVAPPKPPEPKVQVGKGPDGQSVAVVYDPSGMKVIGRIPLHIGGEEEDPLELKMSTHEKLLMRATGRITPDNKFNLYISPDAAREMLQYGKSVDPWEVIDRLTGGKSGKPTQEGPTNNPATTDH